jgi:hypothetical protein
MTTKDRAQTDDRQQQEFLLASPTLHGQSETADTSMAGIRPAKFHTSRSFHNANDDREERAMPRYFYVVALIIVGIGPGLVHAQGPADDKAPQTGADKYCVVEIDPVESGEEESVTTKNSCFATTTEAVAAATDGAVRLDPKTTDETLGALLRKSPSRVIAIDYNNVNFDPEDGYIIWKGNRGCGPGITYFKKHMPAGWNDHVSSVEGGICRTQRLYENANFNEGDEGLIATCRPSCKALPKMNDKTSSRKMRH